MAQLDPRHVRLYGPAFALWDVRDVEAHVRTTLDAYLREIGARLDGAKYDDALSYLVGVCWRLSGLEQDGSTRRLLHHAEILVVGQRKATSLGPFNSRERAEQAATNWRSTHLPTGAFSFVGYRSSRQAGAYDPSFGLSFSTYSRRILTRRCVDWYRQTFGDSRYGGNPKPLSLDQLAEQWFRDDEAADTGYLDSSGPGARSEFVDDLNRHAYHDPTEEVFFRAAIAR